jgi:hypothetical protein
MENWVTKNPILSKGEIGIAQSTFNGATMTTIRVGDGVTRWTNLPDYPQLVLDYVENISINGGEPIGPSGGTVNLSIPTDLSDLTDNQNLIPTVPTDVSDLTDNQSLIPTDVSDLADNNNLIPTDLSDLTDNNNLIPTIPIESISVNSVPVSPDNNLNVDI